MKNRSTLIVTIVMLVVALAASAALADGTETLGPPSIPIGQGTGIVAAGTGLESQPGSITIDVPAGATVVQAVLYWSGGGIGSGVNDNSINLNGTAVTGEVIGGPTFFYNGVTGPMWFIAYRADVTGLGLVSAGTNVISVDGLDFGSYENNGAGILVIYDDGSPISDIGLVDGLDLAYIGFPEPLKSTVAQTFNFAPAGVDRVSTLSMFFGSVSNEGLRPNSIEVTVGGAVTVFSDLLNSNDGALWDTLNLPITIPAGATSLTVQAFSRDDTNLTWPATPGPKPASFSWIGAALAVPPEPPDESPGTGTPGYWKNHPEAWPVDTIEIGGITYTKDEAIALMKHPTKKDKTYNMFQQLVAAKLNVLVGNESSCIDATIAAADAWMAAHPVGSGVKANSAAWQAGEPLHSELDAYNNGYLCAPHRD